MGILQKTFLRSNREIGGITLDAVISERHTTKTVTTTFPVESGAKISDHAITLPKELVINAIVSDSELIFSIGDIVEDVTDLFGSSTENNVTRSNQAYNSLVKIQDNKELITITTGLVVYQNMMITDIDITQDKDSSRIIDLRIALVEMLITVEVIAILTEDKLLEGSERQQMQTPKEIGRVEIVEPTIDSKEAALARKITKLFFKPIAILGSGEQQ